jgi:hypothetical protein
VFVYACRYTPYEICSQLKDSGATLLIAHPMCVGNAFKAAAMLKEQGDNRKLTVRTIQDAL